MKILLIRPSFDFPVAEGERFTHNRAWTPLSLALCAALLRREGNEVGLLDAHRARLPVPETAAAAAGADLVLVTSSPIDRWECPNLDLSPVAALVRSLRAAGLPTALCGVHGTVLPEEVMELTGADILIRGEPESALGALRAGGPETPGVIFRGRGPTGPEKTRPPVDLAALPFPAYDLLPLRGYRHLFLGGPAVVLEGSRGCPAACAVCLKAMYGPLYRAKPGEMIFAEVQRASRDLGARAVIFIDLDFCLNRPGVEEFCRRLLKAKLRLDWCCTAHPGSTDRELLKLMGKAGCRLIHYGFESASPRVLELLGRRASSRKPKPVLEETRAAGIASLGFFMFGAFDETGPEREATLRMALELPLDLASFHICQPLPGTTAGAALTRERSELFPAVFPGQDRAGLERFTAAAWRRFYFRPGRFPRLARLAGRGGFGAVSLLRSLIRG